MVKRTTVWSRLARLIAYLLTAAFVITLPPALLLRSLGSVAFQPGPLRRSVERRLLDSGVLRLALTKGILSSSAGPAGGGDETLALIAANLAEEDWQAIGEIALPDDWLRQQLEGIIGSFFAWLDSDELAPQLVLNVEPVKRRLLGAGTENIFEIMISSWPPCSPEQLQSIEDEFREAGGILLLGCAPPEPFRTVTMERASDALQNEARALPSQVRLIEDLSQEAEGLLELKAGLLQLRLLARWAIAVPAALLGLIMALVVRGWRDWLRWWGIPLLLGGGLSFASGAIARGNQAQILNRLTGGSLELPEMGQVLQFIIADLATGVLARWLVLGGLAGLLGVALLALSLLGRSGPRSEIGIESTPEAEAPGIGSGMFS